MATWSASVTFQASSQRAFDLSEYTGSSWSTSCRSGDSSSASTDPTTDGGSSSPNRSDDRRSLSALSSSRGALGTNGCARSPPLLESSKYGLRGWPFVRLILLLLFSTSLPV